MCNSTRPSTDVYYIFPLIYYERVNIRSYWYDINGTCVPIIILQGRSVLILSKRICTVAHLPSGVWIILTTELSSSGSFRWLWWKDSLGLDSNRIPSGTDIPSLFSIFSANRSAWNAESGILPPKYGNTFSRNSWRFCCEQNQLKI